MSTRSDGITQQPPRHRTSYTLVCSESDVSTDNRTTYLGIIALLAAALLVVLVIGLESEPSPGLTEPACIDELEEIVDGLECRTLPKSSLDTGLDAGSVYVGSSTLMGIAIFSSAASIVYSKKDKPIPVSKKFQGLFALGLGLVAGSQGMLMLSACCWGLHLVYYTVPLTVIGLLMALIGIGKFIDVYFAEK